MSEFEPNDIQNSKDILRYLVSFTEGFNEELNIVVNQEVNNLFRTICQATNGGISYPYDIRRQMVIDSLGAGDRQIASNYSCDMIAVQSARQTFNACLLYTFNRHSILNEAENCFDMFGSSEYFRVKGILEHRNVKNAEEIRMNLPSRVFFLDSFLKSYSKYGSVFEYLETNNSTFREYSAQEIMNYDRVVRDFLDPSSERRGFPRFANHVLYTELLGPLQRKISQNLNKLALASLAWEVSYKDYKQYDIAHHLKLFWEHIFVEELRRLSAELTVSEREYYFPTKNGEVCKNAESLSKEEALKTFDIYKYYLNEDIARMGIVPSLSEIVKKAIMTEHIQDIEVKGLSTKTIQIGIQNIRKTVMFHFEKRFVYTEDKEKLFSRFVELEEISEYKKLKETIKKL